MHVAHAGSGAAGAETGSGRRVQCLEQVERVLANVDYCGLGLVPARERSGSRVAGHWVGCFQRPQPLPSLYATVRVSWALPHLQKDRDLRGLRTLRVAPTMPTPAGSLVHC